MTNRVYSEDKAMNQFIDIVASWMYSNGIKHTEYGTWTFTFNDIIEEIGDALCECSVNHKKENIKINLHIYFDDICEELESYYGIASVDGAYDSKDGYFDLTYYTDYCGIKDYWND